jgi:hypothetical protein
MSTEWDEPAEDEDDADPLFGERNPLLGGDEDPELDEHGDNLRRADEDEDEE